ncbi:type II secretion system F family protein [Prauserella flavalba]|uniref:type II secretion system F family protein n=1 Tax=Prauserella flavalba TaxID=1477506 RepID=UPI0036DFB4B0
MLTGSALSAALALLSWPSPTCSRRLASLRARQFPAPWRADPKRWAIALLPLGSVTAVLLSGPAAAIALLLLTGSVFLHRRTRRRARARVEAAAALAEAVRTMVGELRAGAHPATAAEAAAADADPVAASTLRAVAASARLGGDLDGALLARSASDPGGEVLTQLAHAWSLAREHGLPLATVLDAVQRDVDAKVRLANQVDARMAGPRASAAILAVLPAAGILLGEAMGARPLHVLATTSAGQLLLVLGAALVLAGVYWSAAITNRVLPR